jgi:hypothetical protein
MFFLTGAQKFFRRCERQCREPGLLHQPAK